MFHSNSCFSKLSIYSAQLMMGASLVLLSHSIAASVWANESFVNEIRLAQAQFTTDQLPSDLSSSSELQYGDSMRGRLNVGSIRHQGRRFSIYRFEGEEGQLIRINLAGGLASDRPPDQLQTGALLINPAVILLDPNGEIVAQQPEQTDVANALIRMNLSMSGTYHILVTSITIGGGGQYALTLQQIE
jgi:hypothetical protein